MYIYRKCDICGCANLSTYSYDNHQNNANFKRTTIERILNVIFFIKSNFFRHFNNKVVNVRLFLSIFKIVRCNNCGYGIYKKRIHPNVLEYYYKTAYWQAKGIPEKQFGDMNLVLNDARAKGQYAFIRDYISVMNHIELLEIGAGSAFTSRLTRHNLKEINIDVVEPGEGWEPYYKANNIKLISKMFPPTTDKKYNYIHTSHWLEHVINLNSSITELKKLLSDDGQIFVEVPNCNSEYYELDVGDSPHIHFFTERSLILLFQKYNFECERIETIGLTHKEGQRLRSCKVNLENNIIEQGILSTSNSIPRNGGDSIRSIFRKKGK